MTFEQEEGKNKGTTLSFHTSLQIGLMEILPETVMWNQRSCGLLMWGTLSSYFKMKEPWVLEQGTSNLFIAHFLQLILDSQ